MSQAINDQTSDDHDIPMTDEERGMAQVEATIVDNPKSEFTTNFFKNMTLENKKILEKYPELEQYRPKRRTGPECAWCKRGGQHKTVYTSHWMFGKKNDVICPKLLNERCRNCGLMGHVMGKHCSEPRKDKCDLLPATKMRKYNYREDEDYREGDSDDYDKFPLSSDSESDDEDVPVQQWNDCYGNASPKEEKEKEKEEKKEEKPVKKTWASVVANKV
jgi:hypothetical protein